ncbi:Gfo/Idh/MocA family oxidoreductase [Aureibaculum sp. 2210JD6-5]|uniref:Gfo/Idh/MocA family protein n=1 Tax=Aureibaculum sp. 2210JD6-5 TaxID=3103957 RepID=UPI002AADC7D6|nr:Gfo/Idh/MocA family oxidoreductase [Aureibaculum sp. 2210JD6-5]MDY7394464.1 Gfo/Idh/MocA family oxidoreductase [Aureibaculum sp. 2210JD6-5]
MNSELSLSQTKTEPLKIGVVGLSHSHVGWILGRPDKGDIKIVGIVEPNKDLAERYSKHFGYSMNIVFTTIDEMIKATKPEAVTAFGSIYQHLEVVETCAPLGIHVMVEKPLAVSMEHAKKMEALAKKYNIHLLTNYETTWYATNHKAYKMVENGDIGELRKIVVRDGHQGPKEIGINKEFLEWLTDPVLNGGGALVDFGCYGANLITWLTKGKKPEAVMAMTQTNKPDIYPKVDDEATIVLKYPKMQGIIQASWNWPMSRKDMEVYGKTGYIYSDNAKDLRYRLSEKEEEQKEVLTEKPKPYDDPFAMFEAVIRDRIILPPYDLPSLENNMIVVEILDAAKKSAKTGEQVKIND